MAWTNRRVHRKTWRPASGWAAKRGAREGRAVAG